MQLKKKLDVRSSNFTFTLRREVVATAWYGWVVARRTGRFSERILSPIRGERRALTATSHVLDRRLTSLEAYSLHLYYMVYYMDTAASHTLSQPSDDFVMRCHKMTQQNPYVYAPALPVKNQNHAGGSQCP